MTDEIRRDRGGRFLATAVVSAMVFLAGGCHLGVNAFEDDLAHREKVNTGSTLVVRGHDGAPSDLRRAVAPTLVPAADGTVTHGPLYFESPFEEGLWDDGLFAWTWVDYAGVVYWRGRFLLNALALPISAVVTPPWTTMVSDGKPSRSVVWGRHDAVVGEAPPSGVHWASNQRFDQP